MVAAGARVYASDVNRPVAVKAESPDNATGVSVSTTPQNGTSVCGVSFVAPPSGRVWVWGQFTISAFTGGTAGQTYMGPQVRSGGTVGSGTVVPGGDPSQDPGMKFGSNTAQTMSGGCGTMVDGLTAGSTYNVCATYFGAVLTGAVTMSYFSRAVGAFPLD